MKSLLSITGVAAVSVIFALSGCSSQEEMAPKPAPAPAPAAKAEAPAAKADGKAPEREPKRRKQPSSRAMSDFWIPKRTI